MSRMNPRNIANRMFSYLIAVSVLLFCCGPAYADQENSINQNQLPDSSFLYDVPISELFTAESFHDGQVVRVEGEVVGDLIKEEGRTGYSWITIQETGVENPSVVNAFVSEDLAGAIDTYGRYGKKGTMVKARGTFNLTCPSHQGQTDIHVDTLTVIKAGGDIVYETPSMVMTLSWIFVVVGIGLALYCRHCMERER